MSLITAWTILSYPIKSEASKKEVTIIGTFHWDHDRFPLFNFDTLRIVIKHIAPDLIIIEEDPKSFAEKWYETLSEEEYGERRPIEIRKVIMPYALKEKIKVIPVDDRTEYDAKSKSLDAKMLSEMKDPAKKRSVETIYKSYESLFLDDYLTKSIFDFQSDGFMSVLEQYQELSRSNPVTKENEELSDRRQNQINKNIIKALKNENFKKAVVVFGVTHRPAITRAILKSKEAKIITLPEAMKPKIESFFERDYSLFTKKTRN